MTEADKILENFILPSNFKFIYASADKSGDNFFTWAIKQCDKAATQRLKDMVVNPKMRKNPSGTNAPIGYITFFDEKLIKE